MPEITQDRHMPTVEDVRNFWQDHPLLSFELDDVGSPRFFDELDRIKRDDVERFALRFWEFDRFQGQRVLDVGCGPGWLTVHYAQGGARVSAVDLTLRAVELTQRHAQYRGVQAEVLEGNAEHLPLEDGGFDLVVASGVLHHTPDVTQAVRECYRVLRVGGRSKLSFYRKGALHDQRLFGLTKTLMRWARVRHPGADMARTASTVDDFIRQYDGAHNPVGVGKTMRDWRALLEQVGFTVRREEIHYFPKRFVPFHGAIPSALHAVLDQWLGTMVYFDLHK